MTLTLALIIIFFLVFVGLMVTNKMPALVALPLMGIVLAIVAGVPLKELPAVIEDGLLVFRGAYIPIMIAGIFGAVIKLTGIAENIIRRAVELAGDKKLLLALVCLAVTTVCFMGLYGTGALIMVGMIILPILISTGIPKIVSAGILLMGCFMGFAFNPSKWAFFVSLFKTDPNQDSLITIAEVSSFAWKFFIIAAIINIAFVVIGVLKKPKMLSWATSATADQKAKYNEYKKLPLISLLSPVIPVVLIFITKTSQVSWALMVGIIYAVLTTQYKNWFKGSFKLIGSAVYEGIQSVALTTVLMFGAGILIQAVKLPQLSEPIGTLISSITPTSAIMFVIIFGVIGPLLTPYRGPMNPWGMGAAIAALLATGPLSTPVLLAAFMSYDYIVGITDATASQVVWTAGEVDSTPVKVSLGTLPFTWLVCLCSVILGVILFPLLK